MEALLWRSEEKKASARLSAQVSGAHLVVDLFVEAEDYEEPGLKEGADAFHRFDR